MTLALCCTSHSPLLDLPGPSTELLSDVRGALDGARDAVANYDPELVVVFAPDHYNGFFYRLMPPFCIGAAARTVGDYDTARGPLDVPQDLAFACADFALADDVDVAVSLDMQLDHATAQPLEWLLGGLTARPVVPIFINSVAIPLGPVRRAHRLGAAIGRYLASLDQRVLVIGSGGLSHDPPVPTLDTASASTRERIVDGVPPTDEQYEARRSAVIAAGRASADGSSDRRPLNPDWDRRLLALLDAGRLDEVAAWSNAEITANGGGSAHEIRTWIAAFAALAQAGPYRVTQRYYREAPALISGFAVRTAFPHPESAAAGGRALAHGRS